MATQDRKLRVAIDKLHDTDVMDLLRDIAERMRINWTSQSSLADTEWMTARQAVAKESKCQALVSFIEELEKLRHGND